LARIYRRLAGFKHHEVYDPQTGTARSFLISIADQKVTISALSKTFSFRKWEPIFMERSQKYDLEMIHNLAKNSGY
jgi:uncharacterized SAM-dependent methyltransferase